MKQILLLILVLLTNFCVSANPPSSNDNLYEIQDKILIKTKDGAEISAMMVRKKDSNAALPVIFQFTIYVNPDRDTQEAKI